MVVGHSDPPREDNAQGHGWLTPRAACPLAGHTSRIDRELLWTLEVGLENRASGRRGSRTFEPQAARRDHPTPRYPAAPEPFVGRSKAHDTQGGTDMSS